jgi:hypothetical protein
MQLTGGARKAALHGHLVERLKVVEQCRLKHAGSPRGGGAVPAQALGPEPETGARELLLILMDQARFFYL